MIEMGPGPLGLCPVRRVVEVEKDSSIWLANTGTQPVRIEPNEVVAHSSDHGRSGQGRRSRSREPTPPQLLNFNIDDFTVVSHTTSSFTFTSSHTFFPGWVRVVAAHSTDVRRVPCTYNAEEELEVRKMVKRDVGPPEVRRFLRQELLKKVGHTWWNRPRVYRHDRDDDREPDSPAQSVVVIPSDPDQLEAPPEPQEPGPLGLSKRRTLNEPATSPVTSLFYTPGRDIRLPGDSEESPRSWEGRVAAATLEQEMGQRSVAEAMRPIKDRAVASSSSTARSVTEQMMAEACETIVRERHPASPPEWPQGTGTMAQGDQGCSGETEIMQEPPPPRRKTASTPRPERGRSPTGAKQGPVQAMFSPSPVVRKEKSLASHTYVPETEESGSDEGGKPEDKRGRREERHRLAARPTSDQEGDEEGAGPEQEEAMETEPSADLVLAILNALHISSLPALRDRSTGASTTVSIPWPPAGMEQATPEWRQRVSQAMVFLLGGRSGERYGDWGSALKPPRPTRYHHTPGDMDCQDA